MPNLQGKVAFITGAARGQGRSHALRLAREGADIIAVDICEQIETVTYPLSTLDDLKETAEAVRALGGRIVIEQADVRDRPALAKAFEAGAAEFGGVDIVLANAGILPAITTDEEDPQTFLDVIGVNLMGAWNTVVVARKTLIEQGRGGAIVLTSSTAGLKGYAGAVPGNAYVASKHGIVGLMRNFASSLAPHSIRVNSIHPSGVATPMVINDAIAAILAVPGAADGYANAMPVDIMEPIDVSNAIAWLVSDEARYVTGVALPVDAGETLK
jgi:SDR family mycofactocin-dependent oxidoreductase